MIGKLGSLAKSLEDLSEKAGTTQEYSSMTVEEKEAYKKKFGVFPKQSEHQLSKEDLFALEEEIRRKKKLADETRRRLEESGCLLNDVSSKILPSTVHGVTSPGVQTLNAFALNGSHTQTERILRPKDVISWVSNFDGSGNIRIFLREVQDALNQLNDWLDKKCVLRMIIANKITGQAKDLIASQEADNWEDIKELLHHYYNIQDTPYTYLKEQRNKILQNYGETVSSYSRRFLDVHRKVMKAAGDKQDPIKAKFSQEREEEEGVWRFTIGLTDKLNERVENRNPKTLKEAISIALNAESVMQERLLCRKVSQTYIENRASKKIQERRFDGNQTRLEKSKNEIKRVDLFCNYCKRSGHTEERCYTKQRHDSVQKSNFRQGQQRDRPPPVRTLEEKIDEEYESYIPKEEYKELDDPYSYEQRERMNKSYLSDQSE